MKNTIRLAGIIALAAVIGLTTAACDNGGNNDLMIALLQSGKAQKGTASSQPPVGTPGPGGVSVDKEGKDGKLEVAGGTTVYLIDAGTGKVSNKAYSGIQENIDLGIFFGTAIPDVGTLSADGKLSEITMDPQLLNASMFIDVSDFYIWAGFPPEAITQDGKAEFANIYLSYGDSPFIALYLCEPDAVFDELLGSWVPLYNAYSLYYSTGNVIVQGVSNISSQIKANIQLKEGWNWIFSPNNGGEINKNPSSNAKWVVSTTG